ERMSKSGDSAGEVAGHFFRHEGAKMVAALTAHFGTHRLQLAEDVVQEALLRALQTWSYRGVPDNPAAWLRQVAKNLALNALQRIRELALPFAVPDTAELSPRLDGVLHTLYLLFNEGYKASVGDRLVRGELCQEAIRLVTLVAQHPATQAPRAQALLALMLL